MHIHFSNSASFDELVLLHFSFGDTPFFTTAQVIRDLALFGLDLWRTVCSLEYGFDLIRKGLETIYMKKEDW